MPTSVPPQHNDICSTEPNEDEQPTFAFLMSGGALVGAIIRDLRLANELAERGFSVHIFWVLESRQVFARNISRGGLCFLSEAPFASREIALEFTLNDNRIRVNSEIVRCTELIPKVFDVGVRFKQQAN